MRTTEDCYKSAERSKSMLVYLTLKDFVKVSGYVRISVLLFIKILNRQSGFIFENTFYSITKLPSLP